MAKAQCPFFLMPAGNDKEEYKAGGSVVKVMQEKFPSSRTHEFPEMTHGWVLRGDSSDPQVDRDAKHALSLAAGFLQSMLL
jgi:hypothetical protein